MIKLSATSSRNAELILSSSDVTGPSEGHSKVLFCSRDPPHNAFDKNLITMLRRPDKPTCLVHIYMETVIYP